MANRYTQLTLKERYIIEVLIQDKSNKQIALKLGRNKSTIGREIRRNSSSRKDYSADSANESALRRCERELPSKFTELSKDIIEEKLRIGCTPEQISAHLKMENIVSVSHELIYQYIDNDRKSGGKLYKHLPHRGEKYKRRNLKTRKKFPQASIPRKPISARPAEANKKKRIGHWEGDTVESKGHKGGIGTFVDRKSKYVIIRKLRDKSSDEMKNAILGAFMDCSDLIKTLTVDNGSEFACHDKISQRLKAGVYFAAPYSPWERGLNENTNGLIRRFYPKGTDFNKVPEWEILKVQELLNNRPRKTLGFKTPKQIFAKEVLKNKKYMAMLSTA